MVTSQMTSRDPKKSRSWPRYLWSLISQQPCEIRGRFIVTTNRKPYLGNPVVTWPMTSRDPKGQGRDLNTFEPKYLNNRARQTVGSNWPPIGNTILRIQWSRDRWRHENPKGQGRDPDIFQAQYLDNLERYMVGSYWLPIGNHTFRILWTHGRWRHVTRKVKVVTPIHLNLNITTTVRDRRSVRIDHL